LFAYTTDTIIETRRCTNKTAKPEAPQELSPIIE